MGRICNGLINILLGRELIGILDLILKVHYLRYPFELARPWT
jgi:hypothetical protein